MKNMFEKTDWQKQQKGVEKVIENIKDWDTSKISNCKEMFANGTKNN